MTSSASAARQFPGSGLNTPGAGSGFANQVQATFAPARSTFQMKDLTWADGSQITLRYAPRRDRDTGEKLPAPMTPASIPSHWAKVTRAGAKAKPPPKDPVPDFSQWKKERRKEVREVGTLRPGQTPVPQGVRPAPMSGGATPLLGGSSATAKAQFADATPVLAGSMPFTQPKVQDGEATPFLWGQGSTPVKLQTGELTPALAVGGATLAMGEATPFMAVHRGGGATPRVSGLETPLQPVKEETYGQARKLENDTPRLIAPKEEFGGGGITPAAGGLTPLVAGGITPLVSGFVFAR